MRRSVGLPALHAFVEANAQARALYERHPYRMLSCAIRCSSMDMELQKLLCTIISIRQGRKTHPSNEALHEYINTLLRDRSTTINLDFASTALSKPMDMLREAVDICNDITCAEISFIKVRLPKTAARIQSSISSDRFYRRMRHPFTMSFKERRQSSTELHRIRRALWRLRLYFEAYYEPYLPSRIGEDARANPVDSPDVDVQVRPADTLGVWGLTCEAKDDYIQSQEVFFLHMTAWELEEMECVWYHLSHQPGTIWCRPCPFCHRHTLPDDLVGHIRECEQHAVSGYRMYHYGCNFQEACPSYRFSLEGDYRGVTTANDIAAWPGSLASSPSAGYRFLMDRHEDIAPGEPIRLMWVSRDHLSELLEWGYCMWDRERLEAWCLVDSEDGKTRAVIDWWTTDRWKRERDADDRDYYRPHRSRQIAHSAR
jgi:hypothetical protein